MASEYTAEEQYETRQTLYIVRHGVAYHNLPIKVKSKAEDGTNRYTYHHPDKRDPKYIDSKLVLPKAHQQARKAGTRLRKALNESNDGEMVAAKKKLDCVLVSPLSRCLETAYFIMNELQGNHSSLSPPWVCKEELREAFGIHYSDKRSCKSTLQETWPHVQFDPNMKEEDEDWKPDERETFMNLHQRIDNFLLWTSWNQLLTMISEKQNASGDNHKQRTNEKRAEKRQNLLVVSHGVWMECLFRKYYPNILDGGRRVHNCHMFSTDLVCSWTKGLGGSSSGDGSWRCDKISLDGVKFIGKEKA